MHFTLNNPDCHMVFAAAGAVAMDRVNSDALPSQAANEQAVAALLEGGAPDESGEGKASEDSFLPAKLLNNAAALHLRGGEKEAALNLMYEAIEVSPMISYPRLMM